MTIEANGWRVSPELHETPEGRFIVIEDAAGDTVAMLPEGRGDDAALMAAAVDMGRALAACATMLGIEAMSHKQSGDPARTRFVAPLRGQITAARAALRKAGAR